MAPPVPPPLLPHAKRCRTVAVAAASSVSLSAFLFLCLLLLDLAPHRALYPRLSTSSDLSVSPSHKVFVSPQDPVDNPSSSVTEASQRRDPHRTPPFPPPSRPFEPSKPADSVQATATEVHPEADSYGIKKSKTADSVQATATEAHPGADSFGIKKCDIYQGKWERDEEGRYPLYQPASCPYVDEAYTCQENGRWDSDYLKWKWKPDGCHLPRFNGTDFLERIRGKRLMFVGDSMNRNQFESMLCLLREALPDKSKMYETRGYKITKGRGYFIFKFADYDCTVEFVRSHFLAREGVRINRLGNSNPILSIDQIDKSAKRWKRANILVFNTGHWWTHGKTARGKNYYQEGGVLYPQFDATEAYRKAIKTWGRWIDHNVDHAKQLIIYRGYSAAHFRGGDWDSGGTCKGEREPVKAGALLDSYPLKMKIVEDVINRMHVPVVLLNVTKLTNYRKDGHPSIYGKKVIEGEKRSKRRQDCSHWCLPGIPDAWNELIYATLIQQQHGQ